jgi:hypothetical protein
MGGRAGESISTGVVNTIIGNDAGVLLSSGIGNTFLGGRSGQNQTSVNNNTFVGQEAGQLNVSGTRNVYVGSQAGQTTTSDDNTLIGHQTGQSITSGGNNTALGAQAGQFIGTSSRNTHIGTAAGVGITTNDNTTLGYRAGGGSGLVGVQNVFIGSDAGFNSGIGNGGTRQVVIGYSAASSSSGANDSTIIGWNAGNNITSGGNNTIIGSGADVDDGLINNTIVLGAGATGAASNAVYLPSGLSETGPGNWNVSYDVLTGRLVVGPTGVSGGVVCDANENLFVGSSGINGGGSFNVVVGCNAGENANGAVSFVNDSSVILGQFASGGSDGGGAGVTLGGQRVAIGVNAGFTGQFGNSVAIGTAAGEIDQGTNFAPGIAIGSGAGRTDQGGSAVAIGNFAGSLNSGAASVCIGHGAGQSSAGNNSIILNARLLEQLNSSASGFYVAPINPNTGPNVLFFNTTTNEITQGPAAAVIVSAGTGAFPLYAPDGSTGTPPYSFAGETGSGIYHETAPGEISISSQATRVATFSTAKSEFLSNVQIPLGSRTAPGLAFTGDTDTGIFSGGTSIQNFTVNGTERLQISGSSVVGVRARVGTSSNPGYHFFDGVSPTQTYRAGMNAVTGGGGAGVSFSTSTLAANPGVERIRIAQAGNVLIQSAGVTAVAPAGANTAAALEIRATPGQTLRQTFMLPQIPTADRDLLAMGSGATGAQLHNITTNLPQFWNGTAWVDIGSGAASATGTFPLFAPDGAITAPQYSFVNATGTGLYLAGADTIGFAASGLTGALISPAGLQLPFGNVGAPPLSFLGDLTSGIYGSSGGGSINFSAGGSQVVNIRSGVLELFSGAQILGTNGNASSSSHSFASDPSSGMYRSTGDSTVYIGVGGTGAAQFSGTGIRVQEGSTDFASYSFIHDVDSGMYLPSTGNPAMVAGGTESFRLSSGATTQILKSNDGTATNPSYSWVNDQNTGLYRSAAEAIGFSANGTERMRAGTGGVHIEPSGVSGNADPSAALEVSSTGAGFLQPRMSTVERDAIGAPVAGLEIYNTTTNVPNFYNGSTWNSAAGVDRFSQLLDVSMNGASGPNYFVISNNPGATGPIMSIAATGGQEFMTLGFQAGASNSTGVRNIYIGENAGRSMVAESFNTIIGYNALPLVPGAGAPAQGRNTVIGADACSQWTNALCRRNTVIGSQACSTGPNAVVMADNVYIGSRCGVSSLASVCTFVGADCGRFNTAGTANTYVGYGAGNLGNQLQHSFNTTLGYRAGFRSGSFVNPASQVGRNTYVGADCGRDGTGVNNAFIGYNAGQVYQGSESVLLGSQAGQALTTGESNTFVGAYAGATGTTLTDSTIVGHFAGRYLNTGARNTIVGAEAGIANPANFSDAVLLGHSAGGAMTTAARNTLLGFEAGSSALTTQGDNTFVGYRAGLSAANPDNVCVGSTAGQVIQGSENVFIGSACAASGTTRSVSNSVMIGYAAGSNVIGGNNTFIGHRVASNPVANNTLRNVVIGTDAMLNPVTASFNVVVGYQAGSGLTSGENNVIIGDSAALALDISDFNTVIGSGAAPTMTGAGNTIVGASAGGALTEGSSNVLMGVNAGDGLTTGNNNIYMGNAAGVNATTGDQNTVIGIGSAPALTVGDENVVIGRNAGQTVTIGDQNVFVGNQTSVTSTDASDCIAIGYNVQARNGQTCIGASATQGFLGALYLRHRAVVGAIGSNALWQSGNINELVELSSSRRFKRDIRDYTVEEKSFDSLRPVWYKAKDGYGMTEEHDDTDYAGFIAEEVEECYPEFVCYENDGTTVRSINYDKLVVPLVHEVKKLRARLAEKDQQIADILERLDVLEAGE